MREPAVSAADRVVAGRTASRRLRRIAVITGALGVAVAILMLGRIAVTHITADRPAEARTDIAQSLGLLAAGNYSAARNHAISATKADPNWGLAQAVLARAYLALGEGIAAEGALDRAIAAGFDARRAHQLYADAYLLEGDPRRAITEARKASPRFASYALRVAARAMAQQRDFPAAIDLLSTVLDANPANGEGWADLGRVRYTAGDPAGAIENATRALDLDRNNLAALTLRGELVRDQFGLLAAIPWFESVLRHDAYYHPALIDYAATLGDLGRNTDMLVAVRHALAARPDSAQAFYLEAVLAARAGNDDLARALLQRTAGRMEHVPAVLLLGGTLDYQAGEYQQAIAKGRELVDTQPYNLFARRLLGAALLRSGDARGALDVLRPLAARSDADTYSLNLAGRAFEMAGDRDMAAKFLDRAAWTGLSDSFSFGAEDGLTRLAAASGQAPADPVLRIGYIKGLVASGDLPGALSQAQDLARGYPGAPAAHIAMGDILMLMKRYADAANAYRHAADLRFDEPTMLRVIDALDHAGRGVEATNVLALYLSQNPQSIAAQRMVAHRQILGGDWSAAIDTLEDLRDEVGDRDAALLTELAYAYIGAGDDDTAVAYAKAAYRLTPMNPATADSYGWALYEQGNNQGALQLLEKAVSIAPNAPMLRWHLGQVYAEVNRKADAVVSIRAALADASFTERTAALALLKTL
ncbi:MAG: tetratricopeptide repeat protein [Sphingomonas sp.]